MMHEYTKLKWRAFFRALHSVAKNEVSGLQVLSKWMQMACRMLAEIYWHFVQQHQSPQCVAKESFATDSGQGQSGTTVSGWA